MKTRVRHTKSKFWGMIGFITIFVLIFMVYVPKAEAQDIESKPNLNNPYVKYCIDLMGEDKIDLCFTINLHAEKMIDQFIALHSPVVDSAIRICVDKNRKPEYGNIYDAVDTLRCITEVLEGMSPKDLKTMSM